MSQHTSDEPVVYDDPPRKRPLALYAAIGLGVLAAFVVCVVGLLALVGTMMKDGSPGEAGGRERSTIRVGDAEITLVASWPRGEAAGTRYGQLAHYPAAIVQLRIANLSRTKVIEYGGFHGDSGTQAEDEHGNVYRPLILGLGFGFHEPPVVVRTRETDDNPHGPFTGGLSIHPGKAIASFLFFEPFIDQSQELRLTLPARAIQGSGEIRLRTRHMHRR